MYDYKARMYSPTLGRFLQTDPIGYGDGLNWYNYVGGDPVNATDPSGLQDGAAPPPDPDPANDIIVTGQRKHFCPPPNTRWDEVAHQCILPEDAPIPTVPDIVVTAPQTPASPQIDDIVVTARKRTSCSLVATTGDFRNSGATAKFSPRTAAMLSSALANLNKQGIVPVITSGYRSPALQASLRASNNPLVITPARVSWHQVGDAVDFGPNSNVGNNGAIRSAMTNAGFVWGGNFRTPDVPHYQSHPAGTSPNAAQVSACSTSAGG